MVWPRGQFLLIAPCLERCSLGICWAIGCKIHELSRPPSIVSPLCAAHLSAVGAARYIMHILILWLSGNKRLWCGPWRRRESQRKFKRFTHRQKIPVAAPNSQADAQRRVQRWVSLARPATQFSRLSPARFWCLRSCVSYRRLNNSRSNLDLARGSWAFGSWQQIGGLMSLLRDWIISQIQILAHLPNGLDPMELRGCPWEMKSFASIRRRK